MESDLEDLRKQIADFESFYQSTSIGPLYYSGAHDALIAMDDWVGHRMNKNRGNG